MTADVLLITPPFTQLNTPYPATAYLKGFLNTKNISAFQVDAGIEVTLKIFSKPGLDKIFQQVVQIGGLSVNAQRIFNLRKEYVHTINNVINFLQGNDPTLAHNICSRNFLPEALRFARMNDLAGAFGSMGLQDKAKYISTMYLEDIADFIKEAVDPHFGFSRYAERLGRSANSFDEIYSVLKSPPSFVDEITAALARDYIEKISPRVVAFSAPFPGNLFSALRCAQFIKQHFPQIKIAFGGGFANTELRSLTDKRVFEFVDFICLDDGEAPLEQLIYFVKNELPAEDLKRTYLLEADRVVYKNNPAVKDYRQGEIGTPDYSDLLLDKYISAIEVVNPMHRMWSDGRWNKLTMAHGCYWGKCTFCDISLDYIRMYEPVAAGTICDRMEDIILQTGQTGFHFVDEAAPPALMRAVALEIISRKLHVSWWTNVRFEKSFTEDLCYLLSESGCIGVSGGLEVASDRLLKLIDKGITVAQVATVTKNFTGAGILVHAYLMYGFPTQTDQETVDSLEMVRQLFSTGILQSAFWHRFALTAHSPAGMEPDRFSIKKLSEVEGSFANNDLEYEETGGGDHAGFAFGLEKSLFNYMHGIGLDEPLQKWFDKKIPRTKIPPDYIRNILNDPELPVFRANAKLTFIGIAPTITFAVQTKKGMSRETATLHFATKKSSQEVTLEKRAGIWFAGFLREISHHTFGQSTLAGMKAGYEAAGFEDFEIFLFSKQMRALKKAGVLIL